MNVIGLDLSLTRTGICLPDGTTQHIVGPKAPDLYGRAYGMVDELSHWLLPADLVVIEAIGTRFIQTAISLAYVHCLTDGLLADTRVVKIAPSRLKVWATGKGNADKHAMTVAAIRNGWACDSNEGTTDDEADAFHLYCLGKQLVGEPVVPATKYRTDTCNEIKEHHRGMFG